MQQTKNQRGNNLDDKVGGLQRRQSAAAGGRAQPESHPETAHGAKVVAITFLSRSRRFIFDKLPPDINPKTPILYSLYSNLFRLLKTPCT